MEVNTHHKNGMTTVFSQGLCTLLVLHTHLNCTGSQSASAVRFWTKYFPLFSRRSSCLFLGGWGSAWYLVLQPDQKPHKRRERLPTEQKPQSALYLSLRDFGCKVLTLVTGPYKGGKLSKKATLCLRLYSLPHSDGWKVWDLTLHCKVQTHNVVFYEDEFPGLGTTSKKTQTEWFTCLVERHPDSQAQSLWEQRLSASIHYTANRPTPEPVD